MQTLKALMVSQRVSVSKPETPCPLTAASSAVSLYSASTLPRESRCSVWMSYIVFSIGSVAMTAIARGLRNLKRNSKSVVPPTSDDKEGSHVHIEILGSHGQAQPTPMG